MVLLLFFIYLIPVAFVFCIVLKLGLWLAINLFQLAVWLLKHAFVLLCIIAKTKRAEIENEMSKTSLFSLPFFSCIYWDLNNN